ncbi:T9SS type A sorting domain-containing protein [Microvirga sp. STR05]|uniref:T9SS type A sorting domain-containing protein n=1 Tax=Hymenobacter duratus TaxID=2771356 RepID=A0ABR8JLD0_9BACT|nr:T9SS type A sorting domain-containing protein [Hymenobacter duratus]MBD2715344.1 T9SS type A sorting domain-containing protein [Hymenobacter duratus]MBR7950251.1 T9SS type A sorting domain-containing protein [Microvirga sp. STR05]
MLPLAGLAQLGPLTSDPGRTSPGAFRPRATAQRSQALALPFFDDFTTPLDGRPNVQLWQNGGGVLVSNRFAVAPPTRGTATFDGLKADGRPYGSGYSDIDTLTSQAIDLSASTAASKLYLGFYWQAGNVLRAPEQSSSSRTRSLQLEFRDASGNWVPVWTRLSNGTREAFRRKFVAIDQTRFLHANFQFRFRTKGSLASNDDSWSVDYVKLAPVQTTADSVYQDVATSKPLSSLLARGSAMPVWQYNAAANPASMLNPATYTTINNLSTTNIPVPGQWIGTLEVLPSGPVAAFTTTPAFTLSSPQYQARIEGDLRTSPIPVTADPKTIRHRIQLNTGEGGVNPLTLPNDNIIRLTELNDYYAFDDGTAEATVSVPQPGLATNYYALRFELNKPDQVRSIRISPSFPSAANRTITVNVWDADPANSNAPTRLPKSTQSIQLPDSLPAGQTFLEVALPSPVAVSGVFYAGYGHGVISTALNINVDMNTVPPADAMWQFTRGFWEPKSTVSPATPPLYDGYALMLRPVMTNNVLAVAPAAVAAGYALYPNPSSDGQVQVQGRYSRALVLDALGRVAWQQPAAQQGQPALDLRELPAGLYLVQLALPDGLTVTKRLILTK